MRRANWVDLFVELWPYLGILMLAWIELTRPEPEPVVLVVMVDAPALDAPPAPPAPAAAPEAARGLH